MREILKRKLGKDRKVAYVKTPLTHTTVSTNNFQGMATPTEELVYK